MQKTINKIFRTKKFVVTDLIIKVAKENNLDINEFFVLMYLDNSYSDNLDLDLIASSLGLPNETVMNSFNSLMLKKLISLDTSKDLEGRINETVNLNNIYSDIELDSLNEEKEIEKNNIYHIFEQELGRTISSFEIEFINAWISLGTSEELVIAALKEAVYNGTTNFRYIDAIIHEWQKKGFKTEKDVKNHLEERRNSKKEVKEELFDYNWLEDVDD